MVKIFTGGDENGHRTIGFGNVVTMTTFVGDKVGITSTISGGPLNMFDGEVDKKLVLEEALKCLGKDNEIVTIAIEINNEPFTPNSLIRDEILQQLSELNRVSKEIR